MCDRFVFSLTLVMLTVDHVLCYKFQKITYQFQKVLCVMLKCVSIPVCNPLICLLYKLRSSNFCLVLHMSRFVLIALPVVASSWLFMFFVCCSNVHTCLSSCVSVAIAAFATLPICGCTICYFKYTVQSRDAG